jgi:hypothetical protein
MVDHINNSLKRAFSCTYIFIIKNPASPKGAMCPKVSALVATPLMWRCVLKKKNAPVPPDNVHNRVHIISLDAISWACNHATIVSNPHHQQDSTPSPPPKFAHFHPRFIRPFFSSSSFIF